MGVVISGGMPGVTPGDADATRSRCKSGPESVRSGRTIEEIVAEDM
jgi:hypothetical protein